MATNSQMQLWNRSRKVSSKIINAVKEDDKTRFSTIIDEYGTLPFESYDDAKILVESVEPIAETDLELLDVIHKWVYAQYKHTDTTPVLDTDNDGTTSETDDVADNRIDTEELTDLEAWNKARSAVTSLFNWRENGANAAAYNDILSKHSFLPQNPDTATKFIDSLMKNVAGEDIDKHNHVSRKVKQVLLGESTFEEHVEKASVDTKPGQQTESQENDGSNEVDDDVEFSIDELDLGDGEKARVVKGLYECFIEHDTNYRDLIDEVDAELPPRDVSLMNVINANGGDNEQRLRNIKTWVDKWYGKPDVIDELREQRNRPMGKRQQA